MKWKHVKNLKRFGAAFMAAALTITALPALDLTALAAGREIIKNGTFDSDLSDGKVIQMVRSRIVLIKAMQKPEA